MPSVNNWFCAALSISDRAREEIHDWVKNQDWPIGAKLKDPERYHITVWYSPEGYDDQRYLYELKRLQREAWVNPYEVESVELFDGRWMTPVVLKLHTDPGTRWWVENMVLDWAEYMDLKTSRHGEWTPHITVAELPKMDNDAKAYDLQMNPPPLAFRTTGMFELHAFYDSLKEA